MKKRKNTTTFKRLITCALVALLIIGNSVHGKPFSTIDNGTEPPMVGVSGANPCGRDDSNN